MSTIAILNPASLVGKELREGLENRMKEWREVRCSATDPEEVGTMPEVLGAAALVQRYEPEGSKRLDRLICGRSRRTSALGDVPPGAIVVVLRRTRLPR